MEIWAISQVLSIFLLVFSLFLYTLIRKHRVCESNMVEAHQECLAHQCKCRLQREGRRGREEATFRVLR
jgi:hypothetical protein